MVNTIKIMYYVIENHKNYIYKKKCKTILITLSYHLYHVLCKHEKSVDFVVVRQIQKDIKTNLLRYVSCVRGEYVLLINARIAR